MLKYQIIICHKNVNSFKGHCLELKKTIAQSTYKILHSYCYVYVLKDIRINLKPQLHKSMYFKKWNAYNIKI